jgi:hypothetical protein
MHIGRKDTATSGVVEYIPLWKIFSIQTKITIQRGGFKSCRFEQIGVLQRGEDCCLEEDFSPRVE